MKFDTFASALAGVALAAMILIVYFALPAKGQEIDTIYTLVDTSMAADSTYPMEVKAGYSAVTGSFRPDSLNYRLWPGDTLNGSVIGLLNKIGIDTIIVTKDSVWEVDKYVTVWKSESLTIPDTVITSGKYRIQGDSLIER